jgi:hypothetical protein
LSPRFESELVTFQVPVRVEPDSWTSEAVRVTAEFLVFPVVSAAAGDQSVEVIGLA